MLNWFGQQFKDNGYQLGNDRDAPIFQQPAYWPATFRITPYWERNSTNKVQVDGPAGNAANEAKVTVNGFNWSGLDFHTGGTLAKNFSFYVLPSSNEFATFHFESVWARIDNIGGSPWFNIKLGKFELDNLLSEKRILTLTGVSGVYTNYHFQPLSSPGVPENYTFGIGDNQVGLEYMGHSADDRTRVSAALLTASDGQPDVPYASAYNAYFAASQGFQVGSLGVQRIGGFAYIGQAPTYYQNNLTTTTQVGVDSVTGVPVTSTTMTGIAGNGTGNKGFQREGIIGIWYIKNFDITTIYFHGHDSAYLGTNTASGGPLNPTGALPADAHAPSWNGGLFESHYVFSPQFILINRYELVRMSQQAFSTNPGNLGNADVLTFGMRYNPFMNSRAGMAYHAEYGIIWQKGVSPVSNTTLTTGNLLLGIDFDF